MRTIPSGGESAAALALAEADALALADADALAVAESDGEGRALDFVFELAWALVEALALGFGSFALAIVHV